MNQHFSNNFTFLSRVQPLVMIAITDKTQQVITFLLSYQLQELFTILFCVDRAPSVLL